MTLVFRKYKDNGQPDNSVRAIEREVFSQEEKDSTVIELQELGYELECVL